VKSTPCIGHLVLLLSLFFCTSLQAQTYERSFGLELAPHNGTAQYLELPFEVNFHQDISEKNRALFMLGLAANIHLGTKTERSTRFDGVEQGTVVLPNDPEREFRPVVLSLNTGIGFDRKLGENWAIRIQPYFRFFLQGNLKSNFDQLNRNYFQTGVRVVVRRVFL